MTIETAPASAALAAGTYTLDPAHSRLGFAVRHAMVAKVRGAFGDVTGSASINPDGTGTVNVTINAASIDTRNADRDAHLKSGDFFDVETYPELTYTASSISISSDRVTLRGQLTIKDTTKPLDIELEITGTSIDPWGNTRVGLEGTAVVTRSDWGLTWNAALEAGGVLVSEKVTLEFEVSAIAS